jgi:hypothetical protein
MLEQIQEVFEARYKYISSGRIPWRKNFTGLNKIRFSKCVPSCAERKSLNRNSKTKRYI